MRRLHIRANATKSKRFKILPRLWVERDPVVFWAWLWWRGWVAW